MIPDTRIVKTVPTGLDSAGSVVFENKFNGVTAVKPVPLKKAKE
jgi:hypothetical protein